MSTRIGERINQAFDAALQEGRWLVPQSRADARWLQRATIRGDVHRPVMGAYARKDDWNRLAPAQRALNTARTLALQHKDWVFAGPTAALAHHLEVSEADMLHIRRTAPPGGSHNEGGRHSTIEVSGDTAVVREGIRVTSLMRTTYDCLRSLDFPAALAIADSVLRLYHLSRERLATNIRRTCGRRRGLGRVIDIVALADGRAENGGESKARARMIELGFEVPDLQRVFHDSIDRRKTYRADFVWELPDRTIIVGELDGKDKSTDPEMTGGRSLEEMLLGERRRESRITLSEQKVRVLRFSYSEIWNTRFFTHLLESYGVPWADAVPSVAIGA